MTRRRHILLLGGSSETRAIADAVSRQGDALTVLFPQTPRLEGLGQIPADLFDFADLDALADKAASADMIVDASHGFDPTATASGFAVADRLKLPFVSLVRPAWDAAEHPRWQSAPDMAAAIALRIGKRVFAATGWDSLKDAADFRGTHLFLRQKLLHQRPPPYPFVELVFGDAPFSVAGEIALFEKLRVDTILCRNLGGTASRPKLEAAKALDLNVILIERPAPPQGALVVGSVPAVMAWIGQQP